MRRGVLVIVLLLLAVGGYLGYTQVYAPSVMPTPTPELVDDLETVIWASGEVVPATWASLSFPIGGQVVELAVSEGTTVSAGTVLARLDATELKDTVASDEAALAVAQADLTRLKAAARPPEMAQAEAAVQSAEAVKQKIENPPEGLVRLVAEIDGRVIGAASLQPSGSPRRRHAAGLGMMVYPDYWNQGVGTALLQAVVDLADNWLNISRLEMTVFIDNAAAIHLYEKAGFRIEGTHRAFAFRDGEYVDTHFMARVRERASLDGRAGS